MPLLAQYGGRAIGMEIRVARLELPSVDES
jgi:hypothetical protein